MNDIKDYEKFKDSMPHVMENIIIRFLIATSDLSKKEFELERGNFVIFLKDHILKINDCDNIRKEIKKFIDEEDDEEYMENVRNGSSIKDGETSSAPSNVVQIDFTKKS